MIFVDNETLIQLYCPVSSVNIKAIPRYKKTRFGGDTCYAKIPPNQVLMGGIFTYWASSGIPLLIRSNDY